MKLQRFIPNVIIPASLFITSAVISCAPIPTQNLITVWEPSQIYWSGIDGSWTLKDKPTVIDLNKVIKTMNVYYMSKYAPEDGYTHGQVSFTGLDTGWTLDGIFPMYMIDYNKDHDIYTFNFLTI